MPASNTPTYPTVPQKGFFGHPRALLTLFGTEMWERFSYYGMKAILLFYMYGRVSEGGLGMDHSTAIALVSAYGASIYLSAIAGGWVADRLLGARKTVLCGGVLIMAGHIALALPLAVPGLLASMVLIVSGTGLLKPNISNSVGSPYPPEDRRRDAGFSIFYMGISVGAVLAPYIVGTLGQKVSYHLGFSIAAIGMFFGLVQYVLGWKHPDDVGSRAPNPLQLDAAGRRRVGIIGAVVGVVLLALVLAGITGLLTLTGAVALISIVCVVVPVCYFTTMMRSPKVTGVERSRLTAYIPLFIAAAFFWLIQEQGASMLAAYADTRTDLDAWGFAIPSSWFQSIGSAVLIVLTPVFATVWTRLGHRITTPQKFAVGLAFAGGSYLWLTIPALGAGQTPALWLTGSFALVTIGEMCLSPIGMSATSSLAPAAFQNQTMGHWLAASAAGQGVSAQIVQFYSPDHEIAYFGAIGGAAVVLGVAMLLLGPAITRRMRTPEAIGSDAVHESI
ncbi:peptide MFS transporter [Arthrobacter sp. JSM 101049]|uniref:peptide MFS transporter n=1 Tax=Arthrobacter sp. JSM 101049 TaxID=929097 RepID=UPI003569E9D3